MAIKPVVRYMLLCDDWQLDPGNDRRITVHGLMSNVHSTDDPPYPLLLRELCVLLVVTDGYGQGMGRVVCVNEDTGQGVFRSADHLLVFGPDPLDIAGVSFRLRDCRFRGPGLYSVQFWFESELVAECPLRMR
jgi:hypothetical protein